MSDKVQAHYARQDIAAQVLAALRQAQGEDVAVTPDSLALFDHFHGRGIAATKELATLLAAQPGEQVLDIGCGIGGPARWIAAHCGCHVTGVDLTPEFCAAAQALNSACGMTDMVRILQGSALALPLPDASFDRAYSQNVVMNIGDKRGFYREARRVLKPRGLLALSNLGTGPAGVPIFPLPWASDPAASFLSTPEETERDLLAAGFEVLSFRDITTDLLPVQRKQLTALETEGLPAQGWHVFMGPEQSLTLQKNVARSFLEGRLSAIEVLARRLG
jgi:sarcosine/dimethylglycine N-methyltransferase